MKDHVNQPILLRMPFREVISKYGSALKKRFPELQDREIAKQALKQLASTLLPPAKRGRPRSPEVTEAVHLVKQGLPWHKILPVLIPGYDKLHPGERFYERDKLYRAVYMRRKRDTKEQDS